MPVTARATPNIALIKYWGNRDNALRLPAADSVSMTLNHPHVEITVDHADTLSVRSFDENGTERTLDEKSLARFRSHLETTKQYLQTLGAVSALPESASIEIRSAIPQSVGLASSAAVFGCLAKAYAGLIAAKRPLTDRETSVIARLGSGSAARSIFGGYASLLSGKENHTAAAYAEQIAPASHWNLHDIVVIPSREEKKVGSTEGHGLAGTSPLFEKRLQDMPRRNAECIGAILAKDFEKLRTVAEEDSLDMHRVMATSVPPLQYLSEATHKILRAVDELRSSQKTSVLYTMDAGPTVHLLCPEESVDTVRSFAKHIAEQNNWVVFETQTGSGAALL